MAKITIEYVREFIKPYEGREVTLAEMRAEMHIGRDDEAFDDVRTIFFRLKEQGVVKVVRRGVYKIVKRVSPVQVFGVQRDRKPPFNLIFPKDFDTGMEFPFAEHVVVREGDCILIAGFSNYGKTTLSMSILGENIDHHPILLGNEFTKDDEPTPRFLNRLDAMDWFKWADENGQDKFTLLPVYDDFAENIVKDRINIVDWINLPGEYYMISPIMEGIKRAVGNGIAVLVLQKNEGSTSGRGGAPTKDFADLELLIDSHGEFESRLTVGKCKESTGRIIGKSWAFEIQNGVKIFNIREVKRCFKCHGKGYGQYGRCNECEGIGWNNT